MPDQTTFTIAPGGSAVIQVTFTPPRPGQYVAHLRITHNPTIVVTLTGSAPGAGGSPAGGGKVPLAVPFGGEVLTALAICAYALRRGRQGAQQ